MYILLLSGLGTGLSVMPLSNSSNVVRCLSVASTATITYPCVATRCNDGKTFDLTEDIESTASPRLVEDDAVIDGHKECQILLRPVGSTCLFNFTRERMQLFVRDNESKTMLNESVSTSLS